MTSMPKRPARLVDRDKSIIIRIHNVYKKMARNASRVYLSLFGVGLTEWRILSVIADGENVTATRICETIDLDKAAASRSISLLKSEGYLSSRSSDDGTRSAVLELTDKGLDLHDRILPLSEQREASLLKGLSQQERKTLLDLLKRLQANADELNGPDSND
jgi:DNA-binding MarR family transcriptional regulator